jgi:hypothetical protein
MKPDVSWLFRIILSLGFVALMSVSDPAHAVDDTCIKKLDSCYDKCRHKSQLSGPAASHDAGWRMASVRDATGIARPMGRSITSHRSR